MAEKSQPRRRGPGRPFQKGTSGNPGGRPRGLRDAIRRATSDGDVLVKMMMRVLAGRHVRLHGRVFYPTLDRLWACGWLADRGWGQPASMTDMLLAEGIEKRHG